MLPTQVMILPFQIIFYFLSTDWGCLLVRYFVDCKNWGWKPPGADFVMVQNSTQTSTLSMSIETTNGLVL